jgi:RimJ/RimL family protein N-acetyltransferase
MSSQTKPSIVIEKISLERMEDLYNTMVESGKDWFTWGMIPKSDLSREELEHMAKGFIALWEQDNTYTFFALDETTNQIVGIALINQINRAHQVGNLAYLVRTSCAGQGIATQAARLVAQYGFEKLGLQRIEIIVHPDNTPSLKVAHKLGATREGLLRNGMILNGVVCNAYLHSLIPVDFDISKTA